MWYVYSLKCRDGYYIGCTGDLRKRFERHKRGDVPATHDRLPVKIVFYFGIPNKYTAYNFEKYLKTASGRAFLNKHFKEAKI